MHLSIDCDCRRPSACQEEHVWFVVMSFFAFLCVQADKEAVRDVQSTSDAMQERLAQLGQSCPPTNASFTSSTRNQQLALHTTSLKQ